MGKNAYEIIDGLPTEELRGFLRMLVDDDNAIGLRIMERWGIDDGKPDLSSYERAFDELFYDDFGLPHDVSPKAATTYLRKLRRVMNDVTEPLRMKGDHLSRAELFRYAISLSASAPCLCSPWFITEWDELTECLSEALDSVMRSGRYGHEETDAFFSRTLDMIDELELSLPPVTENLLEFMSRAVHDRELLEKAFSSVLSLMDDGFPGMEWRSPDIGLLASAADRMMERLGKSVEERKAVLDVPLSHAGPTVIGYARYLIGEGRAGEAADLLLPLYLGPDEYRVKHEVKDLLFSALRLSGRNEERMRLMRDHLIHASFISLSEEEGTRSELPAEEWHLLAHEIASAHIEEKGRYWVPFMERNALWDDLIGHFRYEERLSETKDLISEIPEEKLSDLAPVFGEALLAEFERVRNRERYYDAASALDILSELPGGRALAGDIVRQLLARYGKRPALMEVLRWWMMTRDMSGIMQNLD